MVTTRKVRQFLEETHTSQEALAKALRLTQSTLSARLRNETRWSLDDLDALADAGIVSPLWAGDEERRGMEK